MSAALPSSWESREAHCESKGAGERGKRMREQVKEVALKHPRYGHRRLTHVLAKKLAKPVSRRNVQRIMRKLNLQVRTRRRRKWLAREAVGQQEPQKANECWAMDFVSDWRLGSKRVLRILTMVDCFTRESLALRAGYAMPARILIWQSGLTTIGGLEKSLI